MLRQTNERQALGLIGPQHRAIGVQLRTRFTDALTAGLSITAPWGLGSDYHEGWAGRYYALESKLLTVNVVPSIAYRITSAVGTIATISTSPPPLALEPWMRPRLELRSPMRSPW